MIRKDDERGIGTGRKENDGEQIRRLSLLPHTAFVISGALHVGGREDSREEVDIQLDLAARLVGASQYAAMNKLDRCEVDITDSEAGIILKKLGLQTDRTKHADTKRGLNDAYMEFSTQLVAVTVMSPALKRK